MLQDRYRVLLSSVSLYPGLVVHKLLPLYTDNDAKIRQGANWQKSPNMRQKTGGWVVEEGRTAKVLFKSFTSLSQIVSVFASLPVKWLTKIKKCINKK